MSPVNTFSTGVPNNLNQPNTYHAFNYLRAANSLVSVPLTLGLIGIKSAAGTAVVGTVYDATNATDTDALAGASSSGALMARQAYACSAFFGRGPRVKITFVAEPGGGTASVYTITLTGTATADSNLVTRVAGRTFAVGIANGTLQNNAAIATANELKKRQEQLPVIVSVAANVVTLTVPTKGVNGQDVKITIEQQVAGINAVVVNTVVGTGVADHQPALDALSPQRYDGIVFSNHAAADVTEALTDALVRWGLASKTWGYYFFGEMGTIATATALAAAMNHRSGIFASFEGCLNIAAEIATTAAMLVFSRERPNASFNGATVPLFPPNAATLYTGPEVETAIAAGLTAFNGVKDATGQVSQTIAKCERLVTSKTLNGAFPDDLNRDICVSRTGVALAIQLDIAVNESLGPDRNPDGVSQDPTTDQLVIDLASAILRTEAKAGVLRSDFVEADVAAIQLEHDSVTNGRDNVRLPYHVSTPLHQVAFVHDVIIGA